MILNPKSTCNEKGVIVENNHALIVQYPEGRKYSSSPVPLF
jgi:hypothetical protein